MTMRRLLRACRAALPAWMLPIFAACLIIPGPFDEMAMLITFGVLGAVQPVRFRRFHAAYKGGKSHRAHDARIEVTA